MPFRAEYPRGRSAFVPADKWEEYYRTLLTELKKHFPRAKIFLCSPIHINSARQEALAAITLRNRDNVWKFGVEKHMERYASVVRRVADETGAVYIDLYTPSKDHPAQSKLFRSDDGLHLAPPGERFVALHLLRNL